MRRIVLLGIVSLGSGVAWLLGTTPVSADTVELSRGGHLTGQVQRKEDVVIVAVDDKIQVALPNSRIRRVVDSDELAEYRQRVIAAGDDPQAHYELARWCVTGTNVPGDAQRYKEYHLRRAVDLDPEHIKARAALDFVKHRGQWIQKDQLSRERGMITRGGSAVLPEAAAIEDSRQANDVETKKWIREVKRLVGMATRPSSKSAEALEKLKGIRDPHAAAAIAQQLEESRGNREQARSLRMLWIRLLGEMKNMTAVESLVRTGIDEPDEMVREAALEQLTQFGSSSAVATYLPMLKSNDNALVNRAARALQWFPNPELAMTYVESLVTTHKKTIAPGPGMQVGFGDGGGGLSTGGKPKVIERQETNPAVLALLKTIEPDVSHGYDELAWQQYFARKRNQFSGDLRRDFD